jgi:hypothetical protein
MSRKLLLAAAVVLITATAALAQSTMSPDTSTPAAAVAAGAGDAPLKPQRQPGRLHRVHMRDSEFSGKDMCVERFARSAGRLAYLQARLELTEAQQPLWDKWAAAIAAGSAAERTDCVASLSGDKPPVSALDRDARLEKLLTDKLETLKTARPALEALYQSLSGEQRALFDRRGFMPGGDGRGHGEDDARWQGMHHHRPMAAPL